MKYTRSIHASLVFACAAVALSACTSLGRLGADAAPPAPSDTIFIAGIEPDNAAVDFSAGKLQDGKLVEPRMTPAFMGVAENGYVVAKVSAGDAIQLSSIVLRADKSWPGGAHFSACGNTKVLTFVAPPGKVIYIGDIKFSARHGSLGVTYENNEQKARQFIDAHHPRLKNKLEVITPEWLPSSLPCTAGTTVIPIAIPR